MGGSGEIAGRRVDIELEQQDEEAVRLHVEIATGIAGEVPEDRGRGADDLGGEAEELIERGRSRDRRSVGAIDRERGVDGLHDETIADAEALVRWLEAELRVEERAGPGEALIGVVERIEPGEPAVQESHRRVVDRRDLERCGWSRAGAASV